MTPVSSRLALLFVLFVAFQGLSAAPAGAATLISNATNPASFYSASHFYVHYANGYYWVAFHDGTRPVLYSSRDAVTWQPATAAPGEIFTSFNPPPTGNAWAVRYSGDTIIAFGYNSSDNFRYYRKATLEPDGSATWTAQMSSGGGGGVDTALNALFANGKPIMWRADATLGGSFRIGSNLDTPTWSNTPNAPALNTGFSPSTGTNGGFSAGAVLPIGGSDPDDLIVIRATTASAYALGSHRLVAIKYDASADLFDATWFNASNVGGIPEDATSEPFVAVDGSAQRRMAAVRDTSGNIHAVYVNRNTDVVHYKKTAGFNDAWSRVSAGINPPAEIIDKLGLTALANDNLILFYSKNDQRIWYRRFDGATWGPESVIKSSVTDLNNTVGSMESAAGCSVGVAWNEQPVSPFDVMFSLEIGSCSELTTAEGPGTITVTAPASFEMTFDATAGGSVKTFHDLAEDPTRTYDLAGGIANTEGFPNAVIRDAGGTWYGTTQNENGAGLELLEATTARVRVRQEPYYEEEEGALILAGLRGVGDFSVYPSGRMAWNWVQKATASVAYIEADFNLSVNNQAAGPLSTWVPYSETDGTFNNPGTDDFTLLWNDSVGVRTDFLNIMYRDWVIGPDHLEDANVVFHLSNTTTQQRRHLEWRELTGATIPAGVGPYSQQPGEVWSFLVYFKPTDLGSGASPWLDPAVTSRSADYRTPSSIAVLTGGTWQMASENTGGGDDFNEAEAVYPLTMDPGAGLRFRIDGSAANPRYRPFFKIRQWRSQVGPPSVSLDGTPLTSGVDYRAAVKPVSRADFADRIFYKTTLESWPASVQTPDVGEATTASQNGVVIVAARYGNGAAFDSTADRIDIPIIGGDGQQNLELDRGRVELWYQPDYDHDDDVQHYIFDVDNDGVAGGARIRMKKESTTSCGGCPNALMVEVVDTLGTPHTAWIPETGYSWRAGDWVHLAVSWDSAAVADNVRTYLNGARLVPSAPSNGTFSMEPENGAGRITLGNIATGSGFDGAGIVDELTIYNSRDPNSLAHGGLASSPDEYLGTGTRNSPLPFAQADANGRGEYLLMGSDSQFRGLNVVLQQFGAGVPAGALFWEYWNGSAWTSLEGVGGFDDETDSLTRNGSVVWQDPPGWAPYSVNGGPDLYFVRAHLPNGTSYTTTPVEHVFTTDILLFQYCGDITAAAREFLFAPPVPTAVDLLSFDAAPSDSSVDLEWRTGSELDNLGFHLYRSLSPDGLWTRITPSLIPGLGSSPEGASYSFRDTGLHDGTTYYYKLEDVDSTSGSSFHGPVSATPTASLTGEEENETEDPDDTGDTTEPSPTGETTRYGSPGEPSLRILSRTARSVVLELTTPGFTATETAAGVRVTVPGFDERHDPRAPALPLKRALLDAVVGRHARIVWAKEKKVSSFPGLVPAAVGSAEVVYGPDGTLQPARLESPLRPTDGVVPRYPARIAGDAFMGEDKRLALELSPIRYDGQSRTLLLARKLLVKVSFDRQAEEEETGRGSRGRHRRRAAEAETAPVLVYLHTLEKGLYAVPYEALGLREAIPRERLRLSLLGEVVPHHVEPEKGDFGPGSVLFFHAFHEASSLEYTGETTWALGSTPEGGLPMGVVSSSWKGTTLLTSAPLGEESYETNRFYQAGLLEAPDIWLWDFVVGGLSKTLPFVVGGLDETSSEASRIHVRLQGASEAEETGDEHHLSVSVNGTPVGETSFEGKLPHVFTATVPRGVLVEGENTLTVTNLGDTGAYSFVFLDRFSVVHPRRLDLEGGLFEGMFGETGRAVLEGDAFYGVDVTDPGSPGWLGLRRKNGTTRFVAEAAHRYAVVSAEGLKAPRVSWPVRSGLRNETNGADYVVIAPRAFLGAAEPLVERRRDQGLRAMGVSFEEITSEFGHGRASAEGFRDFLSYAYHHWSGESLRYVLLLGDASYDPRNFTGLSKGSPLPALWVKTSYLVTSSDPTLGAVNGEDGLGDVVVGRLPATTLEEAHTLVRKVLDWEAGGRDLGGKAILVADNPDVAGDFEADIRDIRESFLGGRETRQILLSEHGGGTRGEVLGALDGGASLLSYVGHGGPAVWASENVLNSWDPPKLLAQSEQPLMLTFNCLNGYFVAPNYDSLAEAFLKAEGRGTIGAFSPSGLSLDAPAHQFHRALMGEITSGDHERLGDAVLAAQKAYAETGLMPELLAVYHLFADPAMAMKP